MTITTKENRYLMRHDQVYVGVTYENWMLNLVKHDHRIFAVLLIFKSYDQWCT